MDKQNITMGFDDSGVISKNSRYPYFVYAGYTFIDDDSRNKARNHYKKINQGIKKELKLGKGEELKAYGLKIKYRQALYNALKKNINRLELYIFLKYIIVYWKIKIVLYDLKITS